MPRIIDCQTVPGAEYSLAEAACGVMLAVISSDGTIDFDEIALFDLVTDLHPIFRDQSRAQIHDIVDRVSAMLNRDGWRCLIDSCVRSIPSEYRPVIYALAVDLAFADTVIAPDEQQVLAYLERALALPDFQARSIWETLSIKNGFCD